jgi:hypothetical protein
MTASGNLIARARRNGARLMTARVPLRRHKPGQQGAHGWAPSNLSLAERRHLVRVAQAYARENRGEHGVAPVTASALHLLEVMLFELMDRVTGELEPALVTIAKVGRRAYQTAVDAVRQLEALEIFTVIRRQREGGEGEPQWVQDTNAYIVHLPQKLHDWWLARKAGRAARERFRTVPDDAEVAEAQAEIQRAAWAREDLEAEAAAAREAHRQAQLRRDIRGPGAAAYRARFEGS